MLSDVIQSNDIVLLLVIWVLMTFWSFVTRSFSPRHVSVLLCANIAS